MSETEKLAADFAAYRLRAEEDRSHCAMNGACFFTAAMKRVERGEVRRPSQDGGSALLERLRAAEESAKEWKAKYEAVRTELDTYLAEDVLDAIYNDVDELLLAENFSEVDQVLDSLSLAEMSVVHILAYLSITSQAKECLKARSKFAARVRDHLTKLEPTRVNELLSGLE